MSQSNSFTARVERETALVYDLRVTLNGERRFFILKVNPTRHDAFQEAFRERRAMVLEDFGEVLNRGWDEPDEELKTSLRERFGLYAT